MLRSEWIFHAHVALSRGNFTLSLLDAKENEFIYVDIFFLRHVYGLMASGAKRLGG